MEARSAPENWLDARRIRRYGAAELAACDELDGLKDERPETASEPGRGKNQ